MRLNLAYIMFSLSSIFKSLGKLVITKDKHIVVDELSLPGWFVIDNCIISCQAFNGGGLRSCLEWSTWGMPDPWVNIIQLHKQKLNIKQPGAGVNGQGRCRAYH